MDQTPPTLGARLPSPTGELARGGLTNLPRAQGHLAELARAGIVLEIGTLSEVADPDVALTALVRLAADDAGRLALTQALAQDQIRQRLLAVLGGSVALGDHLARYPDQIAALAEGDALGVHGVVPDDQTAVSAGQAALRATLLQAVGADPAAARPVASSGAVEPLRVAYRRCLLEIAGQDLAAPDPAAIFDLVGQGLANLATAVLEAALAVARAQVAGHDLVDLAVIAMGKTGGRELNYVSDVDVIYVAEPSGPEVDESRAMEVGAKLASALQRACSAPAKEPAIWQVDPNLRPEGKNGPLVRTLDSHRVYYKKWAQTWEFQALIKARPAAGDLALGQAYLEMVRPLVWEAAGREGFVSAAQAMRRRVETTLPAETAEREIKLGVGGLRDVEFTVQLLQLVHGRTDRTLRSATTLTALEALSEGGYVGRRAAAEMANCYRWERVLEHRLQLRRLRRTHLLPKTEADQRWLARGSRLSPATAAGLIEAWRDVRRRVRALHQELYFRPLLPRTASLSPDDVQLAPAAARERLTGLGYRDPEGALRHIAALTEGVTRRASIQRQLLPVLLDWLAEGADPDGGLLAFRQLSESLGNSPWFLRLLRDSAGAAERLCHALAASKYVAAGLAKSPPAASWFGQDADLQPKAMAELSGQLDAILSRHDLPDKAASAVRALRRRELTRVAAGLVLGLVEPDLVYGAISDAADLALTGAWRIAQGEGRPTRLAVIAMGSLGGRELALGSDADVLFVHSPLPGADPTAAQAAAVAMAGQMRTLLGQVGPEPALEVDADLRPEGRSGPLARSVQAYREYYERWAQPWERQALLRARPVAGDEAVLAEFVALAEAVRYRPEGLEGNELTQLRRLKARVDSERLPRGVEPKRHLKLGPGGLLDVQWVAELYQLRHGYDHPALRVPGTVAALEACAAEGLISDNDVGTLVAAWRQAMAIRSANVLWSARGTQSDVIPSDPRQLDGVARLVGYQPGSGEQLLEDRARVVRRARAVFERLYYA